MSPLAISLDALELTLEQARPSFTQERDLLLSRWAPRALVHTHLLELSGHLDVQRLGSALSTVLSRREILRTPFPEDSGQQVHPVQPLPTVEPILGQDHELRVRVVRELARALAASDMEPRHTPPLRLRLFQVAPTEHVLVVCASRLLMDRWSLALLVQELRAVYRGIPLAPPSMQDRDYAGWWRRAFSGERARHLEAHWQQTLKGARPRLALPGGRRVTTWPHRVATVRAQLSADEGARLRLALADQRAYVGNTSGSEDGC